MKNEEAASMLLLKHKDTVVDHQDSQGNTALFNAAGEGYTEVVRLLLDRDDVDAEHRDRRGNTPLAIAASSASPDVEIVMLLLKRKDVDANSMIDGCQTVLERALLAAECYPQLGSDACIAWVGQEQTRYNSCGMQERLGPIRSAIHARSKTIQEQPSLEG